MANSTTRQTQQQEEVSTAQSSFRRAPEWELLERQEEEEESRRNKLSRKVQLSDNERKNNNTSTSNDSTNYDTRGVRDFRRVTYSERSSANCTVPPPKFSSLEITIQIWRLILKFFSVLLQNCTRWNSTVNVLSSKRFKVLVGIPYYEVLFAAPKFIFRVKPGDDLKKACKTRLTEKGLRQIFGVHYDMTFAETVKTTVRMFLTIAAYKCLHLGKSDLEQAFIQANIDKEIWLKVNDKRCPLNTFFKIPEGYGLKVMKTCYGLKQAGHLWRNLVDDLILKYDFKLVTNLMCASTHAPHTRAAS